MQSKLPQTARRKTALRFVTLCISAFAIGSTPLKADRPFWARIGPLGRTGHAMAFDAARGELVLFGGDPQGGASNETWIWDGAKWTQRFPLNSPSKRSGHAMAYDAARSEVVLFGGNGTENDTWVWNGTNWTEKQPVTKPGIQVNAAIAYDAARGQVVMLGRYNSPYRTWVWDGTNWTGKTPTNEPPINGAMAMAYDAAHEEVVLFSGNTVFDDTWVWNGTNWIRKNPVNRPPARVSSAMAYDSVNGQVVLYGGMRTIPGNQTVFDTWVWDGANWAEKTPATIPPRRQGHAMAYDAVRGRVVLFGGDSGGDQTWAWDGTIWSPSTTPVVRPAPRYSHSMAYDAEREQVVLFGGRPQGSEGYPNDTWVWDGVNWTMKSPANSPSGRFQSAIAYDANRKQVVLFGGFASGVQNDTWAWDGSNWSLRSPNNSPPPRNGHAMAYDAERNQVVLFGGKIDNTSLGDTWVWDGTNWTQKSPVSSPPARYYHAMAYDSARGQVVLFGGGSFMNDTWVWDGTNWTEQHPNNIPTGRWGHAMAYEGSRSRVVLFGGVSQIPGTNSLPHRWTWDGTDWTAQHTPAGSPSGRLLHAMAYDGARGAVVLFGGSSQAIPTDDTWVSTGQGAVCTYQLSSTGAELPSTASTGSVGVTPSGTDCGWTVSGSGSLWLGISSGSSGTTTGQIEYTVAANPTTIVRTDSIFVGGKVFIVRQTGKPAVSIALNRTMLAFGSATSGTWKTTPQEVFLTMTGGAATWTAVSDSPWLHVSPSTGQGSGSFSVSVAPNSNAPPGTLTGKITVNAVGATNGPVVVNCSLTVKSATTAPFGSYDTAANSLTGVTGSIAITGWALDDIGIKQVTIWRDRVGAEPVHPNGLVYIGEALFVPGARPDVETQYSTYPNAYRAGWGYLMLTYGLPAQGNGTYKIHAIAVDEEGNQFKLGTRTITVDNLHAVKPFGALDQPIPGDTISGTFPVQGWALTPQPAYIDTNGLTLWVHVDGVNIAHPVFGSYRADIASIFPGYANSATSAGSYAFDSTQYANGMHNIAWVLVDNLGRADGIGSRYFHIQNGDVAASVDRTPELRTSRPQRHTASATSYPAYRQGYDPNSALMAIRQGGEGLLEPIELKELDRVEIHLAGGQEWSAGLRIGDELRDLPVGSTFDSEAGIFYWQLGPGFLGEYVVEFRAADGTVVPVTVRVGGTFQAPESSIAP